jgi:EPS-associated MarR family transcriptional regulator
MVLSMLTDEYRYKILKLVEANPQISQRELAKELGVSLGKANFCLQALRGKGALKVSNFRNSKNKLAYVYKLTPSGVEEKALVAVRFLRGKLREYEKIEAEIKQLRYEVSALPFSEDKTL